MISIKSQREIELMRESGRLAARTLDMIAPYVKAGVSTLEINDICHDYIVKTLDSYPAPLNYKGFPKSVCTSVNDVICHGIPNKKQILKDGDILNIDVTVLKNGYHGDTNRTYFVGEPSPEVRRLVEITEKAMYIGIEMVKPDIRLGDIGHAIQTFAESHGYSVVREFTGHGIGRKFHEEPSVPHYGKPNTGAKLRQNMTFTIEPMINIGTEKLEVLSDGWTAVTLDHKWSAQFEHTLLVTATGFEILTRDL